MAAVLARLMLAMFVLQALSAAAQPTKCSVDGKITYLDGPCPTGAKAESVRGTGPKAFPRVSPGLWRVKSERGNEEYEVCGNPIHRFANEVSEEKRPGCAVQFTAPASHTTKLVADCPAAPGVRKGRAEMTMVVLTPDAVTLEVKSTAGEENFYWFKRVGGC